MFCKFLSFTEQQYHKIKKILKRIDEKTLSLRRVRHSDTTLSSRREKRKNIQE